MRGDTGSPVPASGAGRGFDSRPRHMQKKSSRQWSFQEEALLCQYTEQGLSITQIAGKMDRPYGSIANKQASMGIGAVRRLRAPDKDGPETHSTLDAAIFAGAANGNIPDWVDALRPVSLPAPPIPTVKTSANNFTMVAGDFHFPQHCQASIAVLLETIRVLKPKRLILNGDTVDLLAVSKYPKDQRHTYDLRQEAVAFHEFLHQVVTISRAWSMEIVETEANHSGNGTASRWHRYLSDRVPVLYGHPKAEELLRYETWFYPEWAPIRLAESVIIADDLLVLHGDLVRKHAAYSARGHAEKWHSSVMHSHTHRMGSSLERIPAVGSRAEAVRRAYEIGCLCNLQPSYVSAPNWTNGFAIISHDAEEQDYGVELVNIQRGQAVVCAAGMTIRA